MQREAYRDERNCWDKPDYKKMVESAWKINNRCRVCGKRTKLSKTTNGVCYPDTATYGHLYCKNDLRRWLRPDDWRLECYDCNNGKSKEELPSLPYNKKYGHKNSFPDLLIALAETKENEIYLTQIEFKT